MFIVERDYLGLFLGNFVDFGLVVRFYVCYGFMCEDNFLLEVLRFFVF